MKLLYVSRFAGVHDRRFVEAWEAASNVVLTLVLNGDSNDRDLLSTKLREFDPDIVQVGPLTYPGCLVAECWRGPLIAASWGFDLLLEVPSNDSAKEQAKRTLSRADVVFVDNDATQKKAVSLGANSLNVIQFPWGLESEWLEQENHQPKVITDVPVVLCTRSHDELYRVGDVIEAFAMAKNSLRKNGILPELWLTNNGQQTESLKNEVKRLGLESCVRFLGVQSAQQLRALYRRASIYVSASIVDGTSISLLEAMASRVPVLVSEAEGNMQWVSSETGWSFPIGDVHDFANKMSGLLLNIVAGDKEIVRRMDMAMNQVHSQANWARTVTDFDSFGKLAIYVNKENKE